MEVSEPIEVTPYQVLFQTQTIVEFPMILVQFGACLKYKAPNKPIKLLSSVFLN